MQTGWFPDIPGARDLSFFETMETPGRFPFFPARCEKPQKLLVFVAQRQASGLTALRASCPETMVIGADFEADHRARDTCGGS